MSSFANPAPPSSGIKWTDLKGRLLVIEPLSFEQGIPTTFGDADAVKAHVHVIDGEQESYDEALIFPKLLVSQTKGQIGQRVLGRLGTGQGKPNQSPPWILLDPTAEDIAAGERWLAARQSSTFAAPAAADAGAPPF